MIKEMLIAGLGGFIGTCCRYLVGKLSVIIYPGIFPVGTFIVNAVGCLLIGLICGISERTGIITSGHNLFFVTGICGGFTTFSAFANDIWVLGAKGEIATSVLYCASTVIFGIACVWLGRYLSTL
ncbi:MAG: fluoride efflux transporter CrcB [Muribaculaceae bacterium]|nr:fluoride efflux transporter CrcB [Muribaculaceae bacterium]